MPTPPVLPPTHTLLMEKHPVRILIPLPKVLVAVAEMLTVFAPVLPSERSVPGVVVPMPMLPSPFTTKSVEVATLADEELTTKSGLNTVSFALETERFA